MSILAEPSRILVLTGTDPSWAETFAPIAQGRELTSVSSLSEALARLQAERFDAICISANDAALWQQTQMLLQSSAIFEVLGEGVAVLQPDSRIIWANATFEKWCPEPVQGRTLCSALGPPKVLGPDYDPFAHVMLGICVQTRLQRGDQFLELRLAPILDSSGKVQQIIALCHDISGEYHNQQKLDALHQASRALTCLQSDLQAEDRIEVLKHNIRTLTHNLLHYDVIEIRLLDPATMVLKPLLAEGMTPEAAARVLYAKTEGNGVTGYVAATGQTYVCNDTANDPHYIEGSHGARSSLTIALRENDQVIGTFNVESPKLHGFGPEDVQFAEIFCRELASALHTLDLLLVERKATAEQSIEAINHAVSIPVDEILTAATSLLDRWIGHDDEMAESLKTILSKARCIKENILKVGEDIAPQVKPLVAGGEAPCRINQRVLVVDNDERVRKSAHSILGRLGCIVETARDGKEAVTLARLSRYDTMVADIRLPDLSGYEVYSALRKAQPNAHVILMTGFGYDASHSIVKAKQDGLRYVLYKPFRVDQLLAALLNSPQGK
ncbi:MAG: response regulator [Planctomycetes bacterium]|nr:response regulator [Planctomycetota bacterium]